MTIYTKAQRAMQATFKTEKLADAIEAAAVGDKISSQHKAFIESRDFFFLSTVNEYGEPTVSHKGGGVGTVRVINEHTLVFPAYDGNGMFLSMGNIADCHKIGLLFIDFETPNRVRVQATAEVLDDDPLMSEYPGAISLVRARVDHVFVNCARYIHKHQRVENSPYVPDAEGNQPYPKWKRIDGLQEHLPATTQALTASSGGTITSEQYAQALAEGDS